MERTFRKNVKVTTCSKSIEVYAYRVQVCGQVKEGESMKPEQAVSCLCNEVKMMMSNFGVYVVTSQK